jgi:hypothetical protein
MGYKCKIKAVHGKRDRTDPGSRVAGRPGPTGPGGLAVVRLGFSLEHAFLTSLFSQKILRED